MLPPDGTRADLPGLLYEGTTDNGSWNDFLRGVANALGGESAAFMFGRPDLGLHLVSHSWGQDPEGIRLYAEHYGKLDVWAEKGQRIPTAEWLGPSEALCSFEELARTEFFNDFLLRFEAVHGLFGAGQSLGGAFTNLSVFGSRKRGPFEEGDADLIRFLTPHIKRASRIHFELADLKAYNLRLQAALDSSPTAILLRNDNLRVVAMNRAAQVIIDQKDGLLVRHGRLKLEKAGETALLAKILSEAMPNLGSKGLGCAGGMVVSRKLGSPLHVLAAPTGKLQIGPDHGTMTIVFVNDPEQRSRPPREALSSLFRLTPAESRVALLLADGHSVREIADMIKVRTSTLKSQLSSIYRKTGTSRQSELVRMMVHLSIRTS